MTASFKTKQASLPSLEEAKKYLNALDLSPVVLRVMKEKSWNQRMAETAAHFYKNYLYLCKKYPGYNFSPTKQIDEIWHAHILYTKEYHESCQNIFGYYLHHAPGNVGEDHTTFKDGFQTLCKTHSKEFGYPIHNAVYSLKDLAVFFSRKLYYR